MANIQKYAQRREEALQQLNALNEELLETENTSNKSDRHKIAIIRHLRDKIQLARNRVNYNNTYLEIHTRLKNRIEKYGKLLIEDDLKETRYIQSRITPKAYKMLRYGQCDWGLYDDCARNSNVLRARIKKDFYFGYALGDFTEGIRYEHFISHFSGTSFSNYNPLVSSSVRVIQEYQRANDKVQKNGRIEFFMLKYDTEHDKTISFKKRKDGRYTYSINFRLWEGLDKRIKTGYIGNVTKPDIIASIPQQMRSERRWYGKKKDKSSQKSGYILGVILRSYNSAVDFCNKLMAHNTEQKKRNKAFFVDPSFVGSTTRKMMRRPTLLRTRRV